MDASPAVGSILQFVGAQMEQKAKEGRILFLQLECLSLALRCQSSQISAFELRLNYTTGFPESLACMQQMVGVT